MTAAAYGEGGMVTTAENAAKCQIFKVDAVFKLLRMHKICQIRQQMLALDAHETARMPKRKGPKVPRGAHRDDRRFRATADGQFALNRHKFGQKG